MSRFLWFTVYMQQTDLTVDRNHKVWQRIYT